MPYTNVIRIKCGAEAVEYCEGEGHGHNKNALRNVKVSTVNMLHDKDYKEQMAKFWKKAKRGHETQIISVLQSFSKIEFDPSDPASIELVNEIGKQFVLLHYPGRQAIIYTQKDGKAGLLHNHILINDVAIDDLKGCTKEQYHFASIKDWTNEIAARYTELDFGRPTENILTRTERAKLELNEWSVRDDIKNRVSAAMKESRSEEDFMRRLTAHGIRAEKRTSKKYGIYYTYELIAPIPNGAKRPISLKARSYKLGTAYGIEALERVIRENGFTVPNRPSIERNDGETGENVFPSVRRRACRTENKPMRKAKEEKKNIIINDTNKDNDLIVAIRAAAEEEALLENMVSSITNDSAEIPYSEFLPESFDPAPPIWITDAPDVDSKHLSVETMIEFPQRDVETPLKIPEKAAEFAKTSAISSNNSASEPKISNDTRERKLKAMRRILPDFAGYSDDILEEVRTRTWKSEQEWEHDKNDDEIEF